MLTSCVEAKLLNKGSRIEIWVLAEPKKLSFYRLFVLGLTDDQRSKIEARIVFLGDTTPPIKNEKISKKIADNLFELKADSGGWFIRLFYFFHDKKLFITHGFQKKGNKTPKEEIERAQNLRDRFLSE